MAFRTNITPAYALPRAKALARTVKSYAQARAAQFANTTTRDVVLASIADVAAQRAELLELAAVPGLATYARDQENDQGYDVVAEFNALTAAMQDFVTQSVAAFPKDAGTGAVLERTIASDGSVTLLTFTAPQLAGVKGQLEALAALVQ